MKDIRDKYVSEYNQTLFQDLIKYLNTIIGGSSNHMMSQRELAQLLGCSNSTVSRWLKGEIKLRIEDAVKICDVLHLDKSRFLSELYVESMCSIESKISSLSDENVMKVLKYIDYLLYKQENKCDTEESKLDLTEILTNYLIELGYSNNKILLILTNPATRECVELSWRASLKDCDKEFIEKKKLR